MPERDVEVVRRFWDAAGRSFDVYWKSPRPIAEALDADDLNPEQREMYGYVHPEVVWRPSFLGEERHGIREISETWDDYLTWADDYRIKLQDASELEDGRVFSTVAISYRAKAGGGTVEGRLYFLIELRDGLITRLDEYTERSDALEAAG